MRLKAILGIKDCSGRKIRKYRIQDLDEDNKSKDIPITTIIDAIKTKDVSIEGLQLQADKLTETNKIPTIPELRESSISLYEWCLQYGERGKRIITEFESADNFPIKSHDISSSSHLKMKFKCNVCGKISEQIVKNKTSEQGNKCKYCANRSGELSLKDWCLAEPTGYGKQLLQEYINGNNNITPDKISYASTQKAYFKCSKCNVINYESINSRTSHKRKYCIKCDKTKTSFGEQLILKWLQSQGLQTISQHPLSSEAGLKHFDIYLPQLNLLIEHQSAMHRSVSRSLDDQLGELIAQQNGINLLEVCELSHDYYRTENQWCITYDLYNKQKMIYKIQQWLLKNYNIQLSHIITPEVGRSAWQIRFPIKYEDSLAYQYPEVAAQFIPELNYGLTPDLIPHNSHYKFWLQGLRNSEPIFTKLNIRIEKYKKKH